jgi:hypothetical protein
MKMLITMGAVVIRTVLAFGSTTRRPLIPTHPTTAEVKI